MEPVEIEKVDLSLEDQTILKELANCCESLRAKYSSQRVFSILINYAVGCIYAGMKTPKDARDYLIYIANERYKERQGK